jgi:hypothetical protein
MIEIMCVFVVGLIVHKFTYMSETEVNISESKDHETGLVTTIKTTKNIYKYKFV